MTDFASLSTVRIAVSLAVLSFNRGAISIVPLGENLGLKPGPLYTSFFRDADVSRQKRAEKKVSGMAKKRRRAKLRNVDAREAHKSGEEVGRMGQGIEC